MEEDILEYRIISTTPALPGWKAAFKTKKGLELLDIALWATIESWLEDKSGVRYNQAISISGMVRDEDFGCIVPCEFDICEDFLGYAQPGDLTNQNSWVWRNI